MSEKQLIIIKQDSMASSKKELLEKGIKFLLLALPLMFIGPSVMYNALINKQNNWHYLVLFVGILLSILAVLFLFIGIKKITNVLFKHDN